MKPTPAQLDQRRMRRLSAVFFTGVVVIWIGLDRRSQDTQLVGEAIILSGFAWLALGGWRVVKRCARRMRDGEDG